MLYFNKKELKSLLPLFGGFIFVSGIIKMKLYYNSFNINIVDFLDASEIIFAFISDFIPYVVITLFMFLFLFFLDTKKDVEVRDDYKDNIILEKHLLRRLWLYIKLFPIILIYAIVLILLLIATFIWNFSIIPFLIPFCIILAYQIYGILVLEYKRHYYNHYKSFPSPTFTNIILIMGAFFMYVIVNVYLDVNSVKESKKYLGTSFKIENNNIISDSTNYYIGKTKNYIFYYQEENKSTKVYPIKDMKEIEIKKHKATSKK